MPSGLPCCTRHLCRGEVRWKHEHDSFVDAPPAGWESDWCVCAPLRVSAPPEPAPLKPLHYCHCMQAAVAILHICRCCLHGSPGPHMQCASREVYGRSVRVRLSCADEPSSCPAAASACGVCSWLTCGAAVPDVRSPLCFSPQQVPVEVCGGLIRGGAGGRHPTGPAN